MVWNELKGVLSTDSSPESFSSHPHTPLNQYENLLAMQRSTTTVHSYARDDGAVWTLVAWGKPVKSRFSAG